MGPVHQIFTKPMVNGVTMDVLHDSGEIGIGGDLFSFEIGDKEAASPAVSFIEGLRVAAE